MIKFLKVFPVALLIPAISIFAQEVRERKVEQQFSRSSEIFTVLTSDSTVRHGPYVQLEFSYAKQAMDTVIRGFYKNGLKDSLWSYYYDSELEARGLFKNDKETGLWEYYEAEVLQQKYDFTSGELVYYKAPSQKSEERIITGRDTILTKVDRPVLYIGGKNQLYKYIFKNVRYPDYAKRNGIEGKPVITFIIDSTGRAVEHRISAGVFPALDEEALRVIRNIPPRWLPGILNGKPVNVEYTIPISFRLR